MTRPRGAGLSRDETHHQPLYARVLRLRHLTPSGFLCFVFLEGAVALGILLALAELVNWWGVLVLPAMVAVMVKLNDVVAGILIGSAPAAAARLPASPAGPRGAETVRLSPEVIARASSAPPGSSSALRAGGLRWARPDTAPTGEKRWTPSAMGGIDASALNGPPATRQWTEDLDDRRQRARQSASRKYE